MLAQFRESGSSRSGASFDAWTIQAVWAKGTAVLGIDPRLFRKDTCGAWMQRDKYGDTTPNGMGWEVDHVTPVSNGGTDDIWNLQPLQWQNNRGKGDSTGGWSCAVVATR